VKSNILNLKHNESEIRRHVENFLGNDDFILIYDKPEVQGTKIVYSKTMQLGKFAFFSKAIDNEFHTQVREE